VENVITSCIRSESNAAEKRGHQLLVEPFEAELPPVCADPKALRRVLSNLIENSIKYTPDGGVITVSAGRADDHVTVSVTDNGRGIRPQDLPVLFDKFHRGKPAEGMAKQATWDVSDADMLDDAEVSGVGLGLFLARNIMERMRGSITVDTELGRGSTFTLHLPVWSVAECRGAAIMEERDAETFAGGR
jgi:signal transduction histidine kinase